MSNKPKIHGYCKAGCAWETVHKSDFDASASHIRQYPAEDGNYYLEVGKEYKIIATKDENNQFTCAVVFAYKAGETAKTHTITHTNNDVYAESLVFRFLDAPKEGATTITLVYELAGIRYSEEITGESLSLTTENYLYVSGATSVLLYNADATIVAEKGDKGDKGEDGKDGKDAVIDETLSVSGAAADAKVTGQEITKHANKLNTLFSGLGMAGVMSIAEDVVNTSVVRQTADGAVNGINVVDGSETFPKIQGKTVKSVNLFDWKKVDGFVNSGGANNNNGIVDNKDGSFIIKYGATSIGSAHLTGAKVYLSAGDYTISMTVTNNENIAQNFYVGYKIVGKTGDDSQSYVSLPMEANETKRLSNKVTITEANYYYVIATPSGSSTIEDNRNLNVVVSDIQVAQGALTDYTPYFDGLKNAQISGIKSVTRNLFDSSKVTGLQSGVFAPVDEKYFSKNDDGSFKVTKSAASGGTTFVGPTVYLEEGPCYISTTVINNANFTEQIQFALKPIEGGSALWGYITTTVAGNSTKRISAETEVTKAGYYYFGLNPTSQNYAEIDISFADIQVEQGALTDYTPYEESLLTLPEAVKLGEWDSIDGTTLTKGTSEIITLTGNETQPYDSVNSSGWSYAEVNSRNTDMVNICYLTPTTISLLSESTPIVNNPYKGVGAYDWLYAISNNAVYVNNFLFQSGTRPQVGVQLSKTTIGFNADNIPEYDSLPAGISAETKYLTDLMLAYIKANPLTLVSKLAEPIVTELDFNNDYLVWDKGQEEMQLKNTDAIPTVTNDYYIVLGVE